MTTLENGHQFDDLPEEELAEILAELDAADDPSLTKDYLDV